MKSVIALLFTLLASAAAFAPMQQTVGTYIHRELGLCSWKVEQMNESCRMDVEEHFCSRNKERAREREWWKWWMCLSSYSAGLLDIGRLLCRLVFPGGGDASNIGNNVRNFPSSPIDYYNTKECLFCPIIFSFEFTMNTPIIFWLLTLKNSHLSSPFLSIFYFLN